MHAGLVNHDGAVTPTAQHEDALRRMIDIAHDAGLPDPDEVTHRETEIELVWYEHKLVVTVDEIPPEEEADAVDLPF